MSVQIRQWEKQFLEMEQEWKEIQKQKIASDMTRWEKQFTEMNDEYQRLVSDGLWVSGPADFLSIIERAEDERTHSRMLAWLLTPTGRHGLRNLLLTQLLEHYDSKHGDTGAGHVHPDARAVDYLYQVKCSYWRNGREADIVVWGDDFTLVIELKVNAGEPPTQCDDLYKNFQVEPDDARFLFLTRYGKRPTTATTPEALLAFETISWPEVRGMIEDILNDPVSKKGAAVPIVGNYVLTLKEKFG